MNEQNYRKELCNLLKSLVPDQLFVIKYFYKTYVDYVLNIRTLERIWNFKTDTFEYYDNIPTIDGYENCTPHNIDIQLNPLNENKLVGFIVIYDKYKPKSITNITSVKLL